TTFPFTFICCFRVFWGKQGSFFLKFKFQDDISCFFLSRSAKNFHFNTSSLCTFFLDDFFGGAISGPPREGRLSLATLKNSVASHSMSLSEKSRCCCLIQIGHLQKILSHDHPPEYSFDFYAAYINILLGVFYPVCRDLKELQHLAALNFSKYCEPVVQGEANERDTRRLWKNIESHLKKAMQTVYLREISSSQWERLQQDNGEPGQVKGLSAHAHVELPYYSKFLLIAAYLASYNPARTDKRFFVKHHGKIRKVNFQKKHEKTSNHLLGPKPFPLDRLLAILYSIVDSRIPPTANIFSQVSETVFPDLTVDLVTSRSYSGTEKSDL
uniref:Origin recognition complex subunit 5 n=1 Tax=Laticauda laticaudata TaxID=8630 RepID=A0A8C5WWB4_LATLA